MKRYLAEWLEGCWLCPHNKLISLNDIDCEFGKIWATCPFPTEEDVVVVESSAWTRGKPGAYYSGCSDLDGLKLPSNWAGSKVEITIRRIK